MPRNILYMLLLFDFDYKERFLPWELKNSVPYDCAALEVASFLEHLAVQCKVAGATQGQALMAT
ncbi:MAG: hypothetical protein GY865_14400, partial [candidate division Zixibacteria bacterium]|nr:hypothetical protein [candidate division Zixibacteria bacterium]